MTHKAIGHTIDGRGNYVLTPENFERLVTFGMDSKDSYEGARTAAKEAVENLLNVSGASSVDVRVEADSRTPVARIHLEY